MLPAHMHTRANIIDHSFAIPLCLYHGWNKTHELGRDFDKICAPMPWESTTTRIAGKKKKERKKGRKGFDLLLHRKIFTRSGLKKKKRIAILSNGFSYSLLDMDFKKKKNVSLPPNPNGMVLLQGLQEKKKISRDSLLCSDFWKFHFKERYQFNPFNAD